MAKKKTLPELTAALGEARAALADALLDGAGTEEPRRRIAEIEAEIAALEAEAAAKADAIVWNIVFNWAFERWEARQSVKGRSVRRRIAHAIGFEGGLVFILVPLFAWWFQVTLWQALVMDLGLVVFFLCYTFVFNWVFDAVFGLPLSAQQG